MVADHIGGEQGSALAAAARDAFVNGMSAGVIVGAAVAAFGAAAIVALAPSRSAISGDRHPQPDSPVHATSERKLRP